MSPDIATGLEGLGYIQIMPDKPKFPDNVSRYGVEGGDNIWNVYRFIFDIYFLNANQLVRLCY